MDENRFTFCPFRVEISSEHLSAIQQELSSVSEDAWHMNEFRNCRMLSIFNPGGHLGKVNLSTKGEFAFTKVANECPKLIEFISSQIFTWMLPLGRITILRTSPQQKMNVHLDCGLDEIGSDQYKWRFVISGTIDRLYFLNQHLQKVYISNDHRCYVIDGAHPHCIDPSESEKLTLCIGSPWKGSQQNEQYRHRLIREKSFSVLPPNLQTQWIDPILLKANTL